jgi:hypothetical protein
MLSGRQTRVQSLTELTEKGKQGENSSSTPGFPALKDDGSTVTDRQSLDLIYSMGDYINCANKSSGHIET